MVYLDDIIVFSNNHEEHLLHLSLVLERLQQHGLKLKIGKCAFGKTSLDYLGHTISPGITTPQTRHLGQILNHPQPTTRRQLRAFLGLCGWLRSFLPRFADTAAPLTDLLSHKRPWRWTTTVHNAFLQVKDMVAQPLVLHRPVPGVPLVVQTDASCLGVAAVVYQTINNERRIITYDSARLSPAESRYHANEQECLALVWALKKHRPLLEGQKFIARTDSQALTWLHRFRDQRAKLLRWSLLLQEFDFTLEHCPGKENQLPDVLSRSPDDNTTKTDGYERLLPPEAPLEVPNQTPISLQALPGTIIDVVQAAQSADRETQEFVRRCAEPEDEHHQGLNRAYSVTDGYLFVKPRNTYPRTLYVPVPARLRVLDHFHDQSGHPGRDETRRSLGRRCNWFNMENDVRNHVKACLICMSTKRGKHQPAAPLKPRTPSQPFHTVSVDLMGPYPRTDSGKQYILVVTDIFTKWVEAFALNEAKVLAITRLIEEEVFHRFGFPEAIITDNGAVFVSHHWRRCCYRWGCVRYHTPTYHPRANPVERRNQELKKGLRLQLHDRPHTEWARKLPFVLRNLRQRANAATGYTPARALLGQELNQPGDGQLRDPEQPAQAPHHDNREARLDEIRQNQLRYQRRYAGDRQPARYQAGDQVMIRAHPQSKRKKQFYAGFAPKWLGPYTIRDLIGGHVYAVDRGGEDVRCHADNVRPVPRAPGPMPPASPTRHDDEV